MRECTDAEGCAELHLRCACRPASAAEARHAVREWCVQFEMRPDRLADVLLAVSEAVTNAVRHADTAEFALDAWVRRGLVIVSVWDGGDGSVCEQHIPGRQFGLTIMREVSDSVDFDDAGQGTRVTMRLRWRADHGVG